MRSCCLLFAALLGSITRLVAAGENASLRGGSGSGDDVLHGRDGHRPPADISNVTWKARELVESEPSSPEGILILAQGRSGSTMLGELFRHNEKCLPVCTHTQTSSQPAAPLTCSHSFLHKNHLYFYEPCRQRGHGVLGGLHQTSSVGGPECFALVRRLLRCEFTLQDTDGISADRAAAEASSPAVEEPTRATRDGGTEVAKRQEALHVAHETIMEACKSSRAVVVKSIRLYDGLNGQDYDTSGLHVLLLVRDPRGVVNSQMGLWNNPSKIGGNGGDVDPAHVARNTAQTLGAVKYLRLRYEDFTTLPKVVAELVYCRFGLGEVPATVMGWINYNTRMPACNESDNPTRRLAALDSIMLGTIDDETPGEEGLGWLDARRRLETVIRVDAHVQSKEGVGQGEQSGEKCAENNQEAANNPYGTRRHSSAMADLWRSQMPEDMAEIVWDACQDSGVMSEMDYLI
ncbi:unnamed protein product [Ectocarpus sp. CCAP 1310/34]|nr:unnamed protein product [Ectocarpus sp. CCAP 1310/34]